MLSIKINHKSNPVSEEIEEEFKRALQTTQVAQNNVDISCGIKKSYEDFLYAGLEIAVHYSQEAINYFKDEDPTITHPPKIQLISAGIQVAFLTAGVMYDRSRREKNMRFKLVDPDGDITYIYLNDFDSNQDLRNIDMKNFLKKIHRFSEAFETNNLHYTIFPDGKFSITHIVYMPVMPGHTITHQVYEKAEDLLIPQNN